jgi:hypothetical protein
MQKANPSIEDKLVQNLVRDGELSASDYIRVHFRYISFFLTYIQLVYPEQWEELIRELERIEDTMPTGS